METKTRHNNASEKQIQAEEIWIKKLLHVLGKKELEILASTWHVNEEGKKKKWWVLRFF